MPLIIRYTTDLIAASKKKKRNLHIYFKTHPYFRNVRTCVGEEGRCIL